MVAGRLWWCLSAGLAAFISLTLTACDPEQAGNPPPGSPPGPQARTPATQAPRPYAGIQLRPVQFEPSLANGGASAGVRIEVLLPGAPAHDAGLREHDVVLTANARPVRTSEELVRAIQEAGIGGTLALVILRDGQRQDIALYPRLRDDGFDKALADHVRLRTGEELRLGDAAAAAGQRLAAVSHYTRALQFLFPRTTDDAADDQINGILVRLASAMQGMQLGVPAEADRHNRRAIAMLQDARTPEDNDRAYYAFNDAAYDAPWIADLWLNAGLVLEKAGYPESARKYLRRSLLLRPGGADEPAIRQKIAALDVLAEDTRPWRRFAQTWSYEDGHKEEVVIRGRDFVLRAASPSAAQSARRDRTGDVIARGSIGRGQRFAGKWIFRPSDEDERRCFGAEYEADAEFTLEPDGRLFITVASLSYLKQSCEVTKRDRVVVRRIGTAHGS